MYVNRDENGKISAIFACEQYQGQEWIAEIPVDIDYLRNKYAELDDAKCLERLQNGIAFNSRLFDMNTEAKSNIIALISALEDNQTVDYVDYNYNTVSMTKTQLKELLAAIVALTGQIYHKNAQNQLAIKQAASEEELNLINILY